LTTFSELGLIEPLRRALDASSYVHPTPIQAQAIPQLLQGRDLLGCAQTGTGKTAAFALPILQQLLAFAAPGPRKIRALILAPTRELAIQIDESIGTYAQFTDLRSTAIFGGVNQNRQTDVLARGIDILVATPGRFLDLLGQGFISLSDIRFFVLDEADRMLDMGFIHDIRRVLKVLPPQRQNLLFSATMPPAIANLASSFLHQPVRVDVAPPSTTVERIDQQVMFVEQSSKRKYLVHLINTLRVECAIVFTRTKHGANRLVAQLEQAGIAAAAIHGNKSQSARQKAMDGFRDGSIPVLVATDIASRGIDVEGVSHVFNFDLPNEPESYVHRIGRTGRAGQSGCAISFCDPSEREYLRDIEKNIQRKVPVLAVPENVAEPRVVAPSVVVPDDRDPDDRPSRGGSRRPGGRPAANPQHGSRSPQPNNARTGQPHASGRPAQAGGAGEPTSRPVRTASTPPATPAQPGASGGAHSGPPGPDSASRHRRRRRGGSGGGGSSQGNPPR
jgi:ATP-dependent RNA helicase RhlE